VAFEDEVVAQMNALKRRALSLCRNETLADDLVQDTVLRAITKQHQFEQGTNLRAWLFTILRNQFLSGSRVSGRLHLDADDLLSKTVPAANDQAAALEAKDALSHIVLLPVEQQRALMAIANGLTYDALAERENVPVGTIKSRVSRARAKLADLLGAPELLALGAEA
jgi:RNA polymerase sigma-70 factor, ECF subfamily